jgi:hypothetical protein
MINDKAIKEMHLQGCTIGSGKIFCFLNWWFIYGIGRLDQNL